MTLPPDFVFSQSSLQDFQDCRYRFYLRYIRRLAWPAIESAPAIEHERHMLHGQQFHRMVQQHQSGIPAAAISAAALQPPLSDWWQAYLSTAPADLPGEHFPEYTLSAGMNGFRLMAKYDLMIAQPEGRLVVFDWKTTPKATARKFLVERMQTQVYPLLAVLAGQALNNGQPVQPEQVEMVYWFPAEPENAVHFPYSPVQFRQDQGVLGRLIDQINTLPEEQFDKTGQQRRCTYCKYRSYCQRGEQAGAFNQMIEEEGTEIELLDLDFDLEQIAEIEF